jgi:hypothetical protein
MRVLPASDSLRTQPVNAQSPILHFEPSRTVQLTRGWDARIGATKHVNNAGFLSDIDYDGAPGRKAIVIGDSYVEALQVENERTIHGILNGAVAPRGAVYGVGASGSPLSQYLAYAEYAVQSFRPRALVFVVVANDFDESLLDYKRAPGFHYFSATAQGYELVRIDYAPAVTVRVLQHSALARYLMLNLNAWTRVVTRTPRPVPASESAGGEPTFVANVPKHVSPQRLSDSKQAVDLFFRELARRAPGIPALFVVDGIRPDLYSSATLAAARGSYFDVMRSYFIAQGRGLAHEVIDLEPVFEQHHAAHGTRFEYAGDAHWNEVAHELAAREVLQSATFRRALELVDEAAGSLH